MTVIMRDALKPNLLQTLENTPALVHAGPFGNIAHGNSSVVADLIGIHAGEFLITEAGFGADMGAERFFNIKCRTSGLVPDAAVVVTTVQGDEAAFGSPPRRWRVVRCHRPCWRRTPKRSTWARPTSWPTWPSCAATASRPSSPSTPWPGDFPSEHAAIREIAASVGVAVGRVHALRKRRKGCGRTGRGGRRGRRRSRVSSSMLYDDEASLRQKIETVATEIYGADGVDYLPEAATPARHVRARRVRLASRLHRQDAPLHLLGSLAPGRAPGWRLPVREARANVGAGFVYLVSGDMRTMPGLVEQPGRRADRHRRERQRRRPLLRARGDGLPSRTLRGHFATLRPLLALDLLRPPDHRLQFRLGRAHRLPLPAVHDSLLCPGLRAGPGRGLASAGSSSLSASSSTSRRTCSVPGRAGSLGASDRTDTRRNGGAGPARARRARRCRRRPRACASPPRRSWQRCRWPWRGEG